MLELQATLTTIREQEVTSCGGKLHSHLLLKSIWCQPLSETGHWTTSKNRGLIRPGSSYFPMAHADSVSERIVALRCMSLSDISCFKQAAAVFSLSDLKTHVQFAKHEQGVLPVSALKLGKSYAFIWGGGGNSSLFYLKNNLPLTKGIKKEH